MTGRRANQLRYRALLISCYLRYRYRNFSRLLAYQTFTSGLTTSLRTPNGIRTRAAAVKGRCPRPLDDGGLNSIRLIQGKNKGPKPFILVRSSCSELDL